MRLDLALVALYPGLEMFLIVQYFTDLVLKCADVNECHSLVIEEKRSCSFS